jgi:hypothetical protein
LLHGFLLLDAVSRFGEAQEFKNLRLIKYTKLDADPHEKHKISARKNFPKAIECVCRLSPIYISVIEESREGKQVVSFRHF